MEKKSERREDPRLYLLPFEEEMKKTEMQVDQSKQN